MAGESKVSEYVDALVDLFQDADTNDAIQAMSRYVAMLLSWEPKEEWPERMQDFVNKTLAGANKVSGGDWS